MADEAGRATVPLVLPPGVDRDGTHLTATRCRDAQWTRYPMGRARKIGGYVARNTALAGPVRGVRLFWRGSLGYVHAFSRDRLERLTITAAGVTSAITNRTPAGFASNTNNNWQFDVMFDAASSTTRLIAHCTENLADPGSGSARMIYLGDITGTAVLTDTGQTIDGGIVVLQPYLMAYGSDGDVRWTDANQPTVWVGGDSGSARVAATKILRGRRYRGAGNTIAGLLWTQDSLIHVQNVTTGAIFAFKELAGEITVLSTNGIVEYDGRFFWPGVDRFFIFDGTVRELPNETHLNWFYDNLNFAQRQKVWGVVNPRWGEIWWHFPYGDDTECSRALIFNVRETLRTGTPVWYDSEIARACGDRPRDYRYPLWCDTANPGILWEHENGVDSVNGATTTAIESYFETNAITWITAEGERRGGDQWVYLDRVEPDTVRQTGDLTLRVSGRDYPRSSDTTADFTITSGDVREDMGEQRRQMRLRFTSNVVGGDYEFGNMLLRVKPGSGQ